MLVNNSLCYINKATHIRINNIDFDIRDTPIIKDTDIKVLY